MKQPRIVVMAGSRRREALSRRVAHACAQALRDAGAEVELVDLDDYPVPLYDGDLEAASGLPEGIVRLQRVLHASDGLLVVNPEYNGSLTPLLKNTLDWCSRPNPADPERSGGKVYAGRAAAVVGTSPGALGGIRVLFHVRDVLGYLGMQAGSELQKLVAQICTGIYFLFFILMPVYTKMDSVKPVPDRVTMHD